MRITPYQRHQGRSNQMAINNRNNPFQHIQQMMIGFGSVHQDPFFNSIMMMPFGDPFQDMFNFSNMHKNVHNREMQGSYVCQSFVSSSKIGPDGKVVKENYYENSMGQHRGGQTISQKQQAYKNTQGINRIAQQRMLNDKGRKIVRQKRGNQIEQTNHYYNIDQEQSQRFDNQWGQTNRNMKFLQNHQRYLQQIQQRQPNVMQIGYESIRQQPQKNYQYQMPSTNNYSQRITPHQNTSITYQPTVRTSYRQQPLRRQPPRAQRYQGPPQYQLTYTNTYPSNYQNSQYNNFKKY